MRSLIWSTLFILLFTGCTLLSDDAAVPEATPVVTLPASALTPTAAMTPQATETAGPPPPTVLNVWMVNEISPRADSPGGSILAEQLTAFEAGHPGVELNVEVKTAVGQGNALSYLRSGRAVAPAVLPDLIVIPTDQLAAAASEELIVPLDELTDQVDRDDLYPAALSISTSGERTAGYPFALDNLTHLVYSSTLFTDTVPLIWNEWIADEEATFVFPGAGVPGAELALQLYLASGGTLAVEANRPKLEVEPLAVALDMLNQGRTDGLIVAQSSNISNFDGSWQAYLSGPANSVLTARRQYTVARDNSPDSGITGIPGPERPLVPLLKGWAWAISTTNPTRQALAADLLSWLVAGPNLGDWSRAADKIPARRAAFEEWPASDDYVLFIREQMELAAHFPNAANSAVMSALNTAVFEVLTAAKTPQVAAETAAAALQQ